MDKQEAGNEIRIKEQSDTNPPAVIKADVNLSRLPFFALTRRGLKDFKTQLIITKTRGDERIEFVWKITANPEYGYPSPFAKKVHRAVENILTQKSGFPVPENLDFSFYEIADVLGIEPSGKTCNEIKRALLSIMFAAIESKGAFCYLDNGKKRWVEDYFNLYDRVILVGETLPDGTIADKNRICFNEWYLKSLNSGYIKPLDFPYWNSLKSDIARRLYEYLSFVSFATKCKPFSIEYHRLCEFLPITPQKYFSQACQKMKTAHKELMNTGLLKKVVWRKSKTDEKKWIIIYHFGVRAKSELQRGFKDNAYRPALLAVETVEISEIEEIIEQEEEKAQEVKEKRKKQTKEEETLSPIAQELIQRGITKAVAIDFAESFSKEHLLEKIEMHDYKKETGEITTNAAGWLREAIVQDYKPSEQQLKKQAQLERKKAQQEEQRTLEDKAKEIQEQRLREALVNFPSEEEWVSARVLEHINVREEFRKFDPTRPSFTEEEIEQYRQEYKEKVPKTDSERRNWLIQNDNKYNLMKIISELSQQPKVKEERPYETTTYETYPLNSIEDVLGEVARQKAEFEAMQKEGENEENED